MNEVSLFRLYVLRALYLLVVVGTGINVWADVIHHEKWEFFEGVVACMLTAFSMLSILGLRYPLQLLPILMWELVWKTLWLALVPLPQWWAGHIDEATQPNVFPISFVVLVLIAMPWRYVFAHYLKKPGDRWRASLDRPANAGSKAGAP
jgi:hypothetical protein